MCARRQGSAKPHAHVLYRYHSDGSIGAQCCEIVWIAGDDDCGLALYRGRCHDRIGSGRLGRRGRSEAGGDASER